MKKSLWPVIVLCQVVLSCAEQGTRADSDYDVSVPLPQLNKIKPRILFDEAHKNHHNVNSTYKPLAELISNDGAVVSSTGKPVDEGILQNAEVFVVATAMGREDPGDQSPFTKTEIEAMEKWVAAGGSLLLITEHYPFGLAMKPVLEKFGVQVHNGYTEDTALNNPLVRDALLFTKAKGNLNATHPILENVRRVNTFTGSSVKGDSTWIPLLIFTPAAQNFNVKVSVSKSGGDITTSVTYADFYPAVGYSQGICKQYGKGKIAVLAESAFITAQVDKNGNKFGMNVPDEDNRQFVLNLVRWLSRLLP